MATAQDKDRFERVMALQGDLEDTQRQRLLQIAEHCPVRQTLSQGADMVTTLI